MSILQITTVNTLIPRASVTDLECLMLLDHGFDCLLTRDHDCSEVYFFCAKNFLVPELVNGYGAGSADIQKAIKDPLNDVYFTCDSGVDIDNKSYHSIFQHIISRTKNLNFIEIEGAFETDSPRRRAGGFAELITHDNVISKGTSQFLKEARAELGAQQVHQLVERADGAQHIHQLVENADIADGAASDVDEQSTFMEKSKEYRLAPVAGATWINVGAIDIRVVTGSDGVFVALHPKDELDITLDAASASFAEVDIALEEYQKNNDAMRHSL